jgi:hypothetical protein
MRLYHFTTQKYGLLALEKRQLKIARINELNDPFEFMGWGIREAEMRGRLKDWKRQRNDELGILCFSRIWSNPLLWSHYADKHQGIAIGFDVPDGDIYNPVQYRRIRLPAPSGRELVGSDVDDLLLTKFSAWRYESEHRCFCRLADSIEKDGLYFEPFSKVLVLAEVIVGCRSTVTRSDLALVLRSEHAHVESFKARPAFGTFSVVRNRNERLWV